VFKRITNLYHGLFGLQEKLFLFLGLVALILLSSAGYQIYNLLKVESHARVITEHEVPVTQAIKAALIELLEGTSHLTASIAIERPEDLDQVRALEARFSGAALRFEAYVAAIMWGSQTDAFRRSDGGLNYAEWQRLGLSQTLVITRCCEEQRQLVGVADIHFGAFVRHGLAAIALHKRILRLGEDVPVSETGLPVEGEAQSLDALKATLREELSAARSASDQVVTAFTKVVETSNANISAASQTINSSLEETLIYLGLLLFGGTTVSVLIGYAFTRRHVVKPLRELAATAQGISEGHLELRAPIRSNDEIGYLAETFNAMADRLAAYPSELQREVEVQTKALHEANARLKEALSELSDNAKNLIKKDREYMKANQELVKLNQELDRTGKVLVRRDLELSQANSRLEELDTVKSEFVSVAAHQLRTPLTGIRWGLQGLINEEYGGVSPQQREVLQTGLRVALSAIELINNLLDVAHIESGRFGYSFVQGDLMEVIHAAAAAMEPRCAQKGVTLELSHLPERLELDLDRERMRMVFDNLLDNAIKYTHPGGTVRVCAKEEAGNMEVSISDSGIGIPERDQRRLFSKFFRAPNALLMQTSGTGLGLYLVKNIIDQHHGSISVESSEGKGTTFIITLPVRRSA
jgi:signal transduction histidine kinase